MAPAAEFRVGTGVQPDIALRTRRLLSSGSCVRSSRRDFLFGPFVSIVIRLLRPAISELAKYVGVILWVTGTLLRSAILYGLRVKKPLTYGLVVLLISMALAIYVANRLAAQLNLEQAISLLGIAIGAVEGYGGIHTHFSREVIAT
jgi:hypothetical protein